MTRPKWCIVQLDMDGTITDEAGFLKKYAPGFLRRKYGMEVQEVNPNAYTLSDIYELNALLSKESTGSDLQKKCNEMNQDFWNSLFIKYCREMLAIERDLKRIRHGKKMC